MLRETENIGYSTSKNTSILDEALRDREMENKLKEMLQIAGGNQSYQEWMSFGDDRVIQLNYIQGFQAYKQIKRNMQEADNAFDLVRITHKRLSEEELLRRPIIKQQLLIGYFTLLDLQVRNKLARGDSKEVIRLERPWLVNPRPNNYFLENISMFTIKELYRNTRNKPEELAYNFLNKN